MEKIPPLPILPSRVPPALSRILDVLIVALVIDLLTSLPAHAGATQVPSPDVDAAGWAKALYEAITQKHWGIVVGVALIGIVYPIRRWGPDVLKTPFGGLVLAFVISLAGSLGITLAAGVAFSWSIAVGALTTAATAAGVWEWIKQHIPGAQAAADKSSIPVQLPVARAVAQ